MIAEMNDIDNALHEISQMVLVALDATDDLQRSDDDPQFFQMRSANAEMLTFALHDLHKRVHEFKEALHFEVINTPSGPQLRPAS
jgi:hypothetical protein